MTIDEDQLNQKTKQKESIENESRLNTNALHITSGQLENLPNVPECDQQIEEVTYESDASKYTDSALGDGMGCDDIE